MTTIKTPRTSPTIKGVHACPGPLGGVEWNGPAHDSATGTIYVGAVDWCMTFTTGPVTYTPGGEYYGTSVKPTSTDSARGWLVAVDDDKGSVRWRFHAPAPVVAGVTPTAGGLLLTGDLGGNLYALNKRTGKVAFQTKLGGAIAGGVITYAVRGRQYVAATAGDVGRSTFGVLGSPTLVVLGLGPANLPDSLTPPITYYMPAVDAGNLTVMPSGAAGAGAPPSTDAGQRVFQTICSACHGAQGQGGVGANLQTSKRDLAGVIAYIKNPTGAMPHLYPSPVSEDDVAKVAAYVMTLRK